MKTNTQIIFYDLDDKLESRINKFLNSTKAKGFKLISTFSAPVAMNGKIKVGFVVQKEIE